jgi:lycopene cyclase domain-containing protein
MFERWSYLGYTLMFCLPPLALLWLRREFAARMTRDLGRILAASLLLTVYGCIIWPVALKMGAWSYAGDRILDIKLFGYVYLEDAVWWLLISFLLASFISLSRRYEEEGADIFLREVRGLWRSFGFALRGFRMLRLERNLTIHVAAAVFVFLEAAFLKVSALEWLALLLAAGVVLGLELVNSTIERLGTRLAPGHDEEIRLVKDAAAAAVLCASIAAAAVGTIIFLPRILPAILWHT